MTTEQSLREEWIKWALRYKVDEEAIYVASEWWLSKFAVYNEEMKEEISKNKEMFPWPSQEENMHHLGRDEYIARLARNETINKILNLLSKQDTQ